MINLEKKDFCSIYLNERYKRKKLIYSCYKELFDEKKTTLYIVDFIKYDTKLTIEKKLIYNIKYEKKEIPCNYNPLWRTILSSLQKGNKTDVSIVTQVVESSIEPTQNTTEVRHQMPEILPNDYVRVPHNFYEKRYHISLKNYTFDYPWFLLDSDGVPKPVQVGKTHNDRLQWLLDMEKYNQIKQSYEMPHELVEFKKKYPSVFQGYTKDGFPHDFGGYHPNEEKFNS